MEIIEKEKIVEHQDGYYGPNKRDINGKANAGLTLGIIGTALGAWALFGNRRAGLLGGAAGGIGGGSTNINVNGIEGMSNGLNARVDSKIIESAINFWFKDDDFKSGCKVWKYFNMM